VVKSREISPATATKEEAPRKSREMSPETTRDREIRPRSRETSDEISRDLVAAGADVNARSSDGFTALHWAARRGACALVAALLASGADPGARASFADCRGVTALHLAVSEGHLDVVDQLIKVTSTW